MGTTADKFQYLADTKELIKTAIVGKGQTIASGDTFRSYAGKIGNISSECTAVASNILSGKTAYSGGSKITGTIASKAAETFAPSTSARTITAGKYLSGTQTISAVTGTTVVGEVLSGKTFNSSAGIGLTGTMTNRGAVASTLTTQGAQYTVPAGYHSGTGKVTATFANLVAGNVKSGVNVGGVVGTLEGVQQRNINITNGYGIYSARVNICCGNSVVVNFDGLLSSMPSVINTYGDIITVVIVTLYSYTDRYYVLVPSTGATNITSTTSMSGNWLTSVETFKLTANTVNLSVSARK